MKDYKLLIKFPTRSRPEKFFNILDEYYKLLKNPNYEFVVSCDIDDLSMNNDAVKNKLDSYINLKYYFDDNKSKIQAVNNNLSDKIFDIVLLASDDMLPIVEGYDEIIRQKMEENFPDTDGVLWFNDGFQGQNLNTLSILGKKYYDRFDYLYHPEYRSLYPDTEFTIVSQQLKKAKYFDEIIIKHIQYSIVKETPDELYLRNDSLESVDRAVFLDRKSRNFDLNSIKFSIMICSLKARKKYLERLLNILKPQKTNEVEVLCLIDEGELSIGAKRQKLLNSSKGKYVAFIDDDDLVSDNYVELILEGIKQNPDVIGIHLIMNTDGKLSGKTYHSLKYNRWYDEAGDDPSWRYYYRNPNHLNPIKRELALKSKYPNISNGEDRVFSMNVLPFLKTEYYIDSPIYFYEVRTFKEV